MVKLPGLEHVVNRASAPTRPSSPGTGASVRGLAAVALGVLLAAAGSGAGAGAPAGGPTAGRSRATRAISDEVLGSAISTTNSSWFARAFLVRSLGPGREAHLRRAGIQARRRPAGRALPPERLPPRADRHARPPRAHRTSTSPSGSPKVSRSGSRPRHPRRGLAPREGAPGDPGGSPAAASATRSTATSCRRRPTPSPGGSGIAGIPSARVFTSFETNKDAMTAPVTFETVAGNRAVIGRRQRGRAPTGSRRNSSGICSISRPGRPYLAGRAVPEPAQPLLVRPVPLRHRQHRLAPSSSRRRFGAGAGPGERGEAPADPRRPWLRHRRLLPRVARVDHPELPRERRTDSGPDQPDLEGGRGRARSTGAWRTASAPTRAKTRSAPRTSTSIWAPPCAGRPSSRPTTPSRSRLFTERRSEFKVYLRQETGTTVTLRRETPRRRYPAGAGVHAVVRPHRGHARELLRLVQCLYAGRGRAAAPEPRARHPDRHRRPSPGSTTRSIRLADRSRRLEVTWSSRFLGSSSFQQFVRTVADYSWYRPLSRDVVFSWRVRGGAHLRADRRRRDPERQLRSAGAAVLRRRPQRRARLRAQRARPGGLRGVRRARRTAPPSQGRPINPDSVTVAATGGNTLAVGNVELRVPSPGVQLAAPARRCSWTPAASGSAAATSPTPVIRVTPGHRSPARHTARARPGWTWPTIRTSCRRGPSSRSTPWAALAAGAGPGARTSWAGTRKFTFHFAVGQAF